MRKFSLLLSVLVLAAMILAACGGEETSTSIPTQNVPPVTVEATGTEAGAATEAPTGGTATETPGIPVTGNANPASLSAELTFPVLSQDGQQIGTVSDMVLDLDNTNIAYVVVDTSGFGDLGDRQVLVPWDSLTLQAGAGTGTGTGTGLATATAGTGTGTGLATDTPSAGTGGTGLATATAGTGTGLATDTPSAGTGGTGLATATATTGTGGNTGGQQNAFILQTDLDTFSNAPDFDLSSLPQMGQPANDWDLDIRNYWQNGGASGSTTTVTPSANGTAMPDTTATAGTGTGGTVATATSGTGTGQATATTTTGTGGTGLATATAGTGTGTSTGTGTAALQGVVLATDILGSTVTIGAQGTGTGTGTGLATATAGTGTGGVGQATATAGTGTGGTVATATSGTGTGGTGQATATTTTGTGGTGLATATAGTGTGTGSMVATIEDMIVDTNSGNIMYVVLNTNSGTEKLIPVPLSVFQWDNSAQGFALNADASMLQNAPAFENGQIPDTTTSGWNSQFDTFWQTNGAGGSGTGSGSGAQATATP